MGCINSKSFKANKSLTHIGRATRIEINDLPSKFDYAVKKKGEDDTEKYLDDISYKGEDDIL